MDALILDSAGKNNIPRYGHLSHNSGGNCKALVDTGESRMHYPSCPKVGGNKNSKTGSICPIRWESYPEISSDIGGGLGISGKKDEEAEQYEQ